MKAIIRRLQLEVGEFLESHEGDLQPFDRYADDPLGFIRDVLHGEPWAAQEEICDAVRDRPQVVVRSCNAAGKDWVAARLALWWVYAKRGLVLLTGPTERQVIEVCMSEVAAAYRRGNLPGELYRTALRVEGAGGVLAFTSTTASRLTGFHAPRVLAILTEAQGVEPYAVEAMHACATGSEDRVLMVGNPLSPSGRFYTASRSAQWHAIQVSASDHPNLNGGPEIPGGPSQAFVDRLRSEYGAGSGTYRSRVVGEFPDESEFGLISRSVLERAAELDLPASGERVAAVDPARYGPDATVLAVRRGPVLVKLKSWHRAATTETASRIRAELGQFPGTVIVDSVGVGGGVADRLRELGIKVTEYNAGRRARQRRRFSNRRGEDFWHLRGLLEDSKIRLVQDERLFDELCAIQWSPDESGRVKLEPKDKLRARLGRSPDYADAVGILFSGYERPGVPDLAPSYW